MSARVELKKHFEQTYSLTHSGIGSWKMQDLMNPGHRDEMQLLKGNCIPCTVTCTPYQLTKNKGTDGTFIKQACLSMSQQFVAWKSFLNSIIKPTIFRSRSRVSKATQSLIQWDPGIESCQCLADVKRSFPPYVAVWRYHLKIPVPPHVMFVMQVISYSYKL